MSDAIPVHGEQDPTVGKQLPNKEFVVTDTLIGDYFEGLGLDRSAFDRGEAPVPSMIAAAADDYFLESAFSQQRGHLWMRQEWTFVKPLEANGVYVTEAHIDEIYTKRDRTVVNTAVNLFDASGEAVLTSNHHQSFLLAAPIENVEFRDPQKKPGARKFVVPEGRTLDGFARSITLEMCGQYFHGSKIYHTDRQASEALGFEDVVVGGRMTMSYVGHLLDGYFGERWFDGGRLDVKFTNPCWPDERIHIKAVALDTDGDRQPVFAWIEKEDGTIVLIANASAAA